MTTVKISKILIVDKGTHFVAIVLDYFIATSGKDLFEIQKRLWAIIHTYQTIGKINELNEAPKEYFDMYNSIHSKSISFDAQKYWENAEIRIIEEK